ncbi:MAG: GTP cyclohydrolase I FolE2 [Deltaproteobacteria bacterium]|nr:MAG: GTP cyclohydrolase I FolE2 [Deltaproteobacteria bacterium]
MSESLNLFADLPDHASESDERGIAIERVGIRGLSYPIQVMDKQNQMQGTVAQIEMCVGLPADQKGTHMSRFVQILNQVRGELTIRNIGGILAQVQRELEADDAFIEMTFPYFIEKEAPVSRARSLMEYHCGFKASRRGPVEDFELRVTVPVKSLCPCSKSISEYGAHNQRSLIQVKLRSRQLVWIEDVVEAVEACGSSPLYALLKREDEKWVTEKAYENPKFVEDLVRDVVTAVRKLEGVHEVHVAAENFESIHNHSAFAALSWSAEDADDAQGRLALQTSPTKEAEDFGTWLKAQRLARNISQSEMADRLAIGNSYLSRVESGAKPLSVDTLERAAEVLGQDPVVVKLRAGVIPAELLAAVQGDPEGFLRWGAQRGVSPSPAQ